MVATDGFGAFVVAPRLVELRRTHPHLDIELIIMTEHGSLSARQSDIAATPGGAAAARSAWCSGRRLRPESLCHTGISASAPPISGLADLIDYTLIWYVDALSLDVAPLRILDSLPHKQRGAVQTNITGHRTAWPAARIASHRSRGLANPTRRVEGGSARIILGAPHLPAGDPTRTTAGRAGTGGRTVSVHDCDD